MKIRCIIILLVLFSIAYIFTYLLFNFLSEYYKLIYMSFMSFLLIVLIIDSYSLLDELNTSKKDNEDLHKLLNFHLIEQKRMQKLINILKTKDRYY
uniref:Uncharacterized protein n=1 Tax=viral metagenome TaxID=1070528 RepID=A0A6C0LHN0_9ZZZZ